MAISSIEWTQNVWNPVTGCTRISEGCAHCYAERFAGRLKAMGLPKYKNGFEVTLQPEALSEPCKWKKPRMIFVNSMSDLFHEDIPDDYIHKVFKVMNENPQHVFQILTKRAERLYKMAPDLKWTHNIWQGVTVESSKNKQRIEMLRSTPAKTKFISFEPLLGAIGSLDLTEMDWLIVGGESGPGARPMEKEWVESIRKQSEKQGTAFFFKQWGGTNKKKAGRLLNGKEYNGMPEVAGY